MSALIGKHILLGITGGIATYKTAFLIRLFIKAGAQVKCIMTPEAEEFVTPLTLSTLSKNPVVSSFTDTEKNWNNHVKLAEWADFMLIAPATANTLSKMIIGKSDNLLMTTYLSANCPVYIAPAMDLEMYQHDTTKTNLSQLTNSGHIIIEPESGELASGLEGKVRMAEPENIVEFISQHLLKQMPLFNKKVLITAGPTYEPIDPVRFIGNHSSGKMGYEMAKTALNLGAKVILISGPTHLTLTHPNLELIKISTAQEMFDNAMTFYDNVDIAIASAAVSDYKPKTFHNQKVKTTEDTFRIDLVKNPDILKTFGQQKKHQFLVGFALETNDEVENAKQKLEKKNLDFIVLNSLQDKGAGFKNDTNKISIITKDDIKRFDVKPKSEVAKDIFNEILNTRFNNKADA
ncbi:bifunctional phosphopantothenoylcysteine decarboxylase/phosphopantothenate--cysteine ligase CoaBC [Flavobacterium sp. CS20]|uniref:bifunctional phosphopantothenoylcysteine decarboxylase/phosphopantothenate--cysteine ligase CoaBC n=1 Tax=Flavobacterium sp. CS20 TaxID=2775246 RepID=UPI001B3A261A|nr:bifunctional phosphopantothenoylcysteine decarboxylase/phosphopantothenate--cysteine ligase CoaBC [Flavobacterium sp. CS20]QTY28186.1 bifunctional phosphopantothenoylcysteine decarboxylase/phosphopantothenate--cysteine ligase CoaBC [Flavobacterium sp. CS20]